MINGLIVKYPSVDAKMVIGEYDEGLVLSSCVLTENTMSLTIKQLPPTKEFYSLLRAKCV